MALENGGVVKALNAKGAADRYSRKDMDQLGQYVGQFGAKGLCMAESRRRRIERSNC